MGACGTMWRKFRAVSPYGFVWDYVGERDEERMVRFESPCGFVDHYEGEQGAERRVLVEFSHGY